MADVTVSSGTTLITGEELANRADIGPCELVAGRIMPMSPTGNELGAIERTVCRLLDSFVEAHRLGKIRVGEVGIYTRRNPDTVRAADVLFISNEPYARRSGTTAFLDVAPELIVEILSPRDSVMDLADKLREYFALGVTLVWVVDPRRRSVYVFRAPTDVREIREDERLSGEVVLPGFETPVAALFQD
jgi:Uma2 family endonuclease